MADPATSLHPNEMHGFLDRWRAGDRAAADDLIRRAGDRLQRLAHRMYRGFPNVRSLAEPVDVIQDSWLRLLRTLRSLRPANTREFFTLAAVHVRRELLDLARRARSKRHQLVSLPVGGDGGATSGIPVPEPDHRAPDDFDLWVRFHEAVEQLDPQKREVVSLIFYHGRTQVEVAAWFGRDVRTIRRWWADACTELRALVGGTFPGGA
jgi:RNA polymerase sigma-70 factor (ECF subfamily)